MPAAPIKSPVTGLPVPDHYVHSSSAFFRDTAGRHLLLRGVNLSGSSKAPLPQPSQALDDFWEAAERGGESFVGQPLRLDDGSADVHLARLKGWGFNMLRYVVTWESLEREGPGKYDEEFMDYTVEVLRKCKEYGFRVFMDPHQDVWSRFSGGSGAPYWTLPACGFNPRNFTVTKAAFIHSEYPSPDAPDPASLPAMIWGTNYARLVSQTVFTLFFGGRDFAPKCIIDGVNIQDYLQGHYNAAMMRLADRVREAGDLLDECVIGWDSLNEPAEGMIGLLDLSSLPKSQALKKGPTPTAFESMRLGMGEAVTVENWNFTAMGPAKSGTVTIDPQGKTCWLDPSAEAGGSRWGWKRDPGWALGTCIWALHGVWDPATTTLLRKDYFATVPSQPSRTVSFVPDYWRPAWNVWAREVRKAHPEAIHFIQPPVFHQPPVLDEAELGGRACSSPHWYDGLTLLTRHWNWFNADALGMLRGKYINVIQSIRIGEGNIRKCFQEQFGVLKQDTFDILGQYPTLIGECGIPFDLDGKAAYGYQDGGKGRGDYTIHQRALDATLNATDGPNVINYTIWTYCVDNSHQWGDNWNLEDLSLWSPDDTKAGAPEDGAPRVKQVEPAETVIARPDFERSPSTQGLMSPSASSGLDTVGAASSASAPSTAAARPLGQRFHLDRDVLTNGARAVGAFSRPFPAATFGVPKRVDFDIKRASFKLTVEVPAGDAMAADGPPTEVFLPWVHYASVERFAADPAAPPVVFRGDAKSGARPRPAEAGSSTSSRSGSPASSVTKAARKVETVTVENLADSTWSGETATVTAMAHGQQQQRQHQQTTTAILPPFELDLEVSVSGGRYEVEGQTLRWWYHPTAAAKPASYTLTVKRRGGARKEMVHPLGQASAAWNAKALFLSWLFSLWSLCKTISKPHRQKKFALEGDEGKAARRTGR